MNTHRVRQGLLFPIVVLVLVATVYWPGLDGGFLFDDFSNLVQNESVRHATLSPRALWQAMWSSPSTELQRPLAMFSFGLGTAIHGFDPFWFKVANLAIHLVNTTLLAMVGARLLRAGVVAMPPELRFKLAWVLALAWAVLPINLTPVLYVVQRMESLAATFVFLGLLAYLRLRQDDGSASAPWRSLGLLAAFTVIGLTAKESAAVVPAFAFALELLLLGFRDQERTRLVCFRRAWTGLALAGCVVATWVVYKFSSTIYWGMRDFDVTQRLLTEARVLWRYAYETLLPLPGTVGFYYDDMPVSRSLRVPLTTLPAVLAHAAVAGLAIALAKRRPLFSLGVAWFYIAHAMTAGPLPLEIAFEHRNYLASYGLLLAVAASLPAREPMSFTRPVVYAFALWLCLASVATHVRAWEWSHPYRLALANAAIGSASSRAQYDLGMAHLVQSAVGDSEVNRIAAMNAFRRAAELDGASSAPVGALVTVDARRGVAPSPQAWSALKDKLRQGPIGNAEIAVVKDVEKCVGEDGCALTHSQVNELYESALVSGRDTPALYLFYVKWNMAEGHHAANRRVLRMCVERHPSASQCAREAAGLGELSLPLDPN